MLQKHAVPSHSKGAQRRRRLHRAVDRWDADRRLCAEPSRRVAHITLTMNTDDVEAAYGQVKRFWAAARQRWLGLRYFCWLELQRSGRVHYEAIWLNYPLRSEVDLFAWVDHAWGVGRTSVRRLHGPGGAERMVDYARNYAKKMGRKSYQQRYDEVPRGLRTFMSHQLETPVKILEQHQTRDVWSYYGEQLAPIAERPGHTRYVAPYLVHVGQLEHVVPPGGRCTAADYRKERHAVRGPKRDAAL